MKTLDSDNGRLGRELADLQSRLALGERTEKESRREVLGLRQKVLKGESSLEALKQEVTEEVGCASQRRMGYCVPAFPPEECAEPTAPKTLSVVFLLTTKRTVGLMCTDPKRAFWGGGEDSLA